MMTSMMCSTITSVMPEPWMSRTRWIASCTSAWVISHARTPQHGARSGFGFGAMRGAKKRADHDILQHRHALECQWHLKSSGKAELGSSLRRQTGDVVAFEQNLARRRQQVAGQAI